MYDGDTTTKMRTIDDDDKMMKVSIQTEIRISTQTYMHKYNLKIIFITYNILNIFLNKDFWVPFVDLFLHELYLD